VIILGDKYEFTKYERLYLKKNSLDITHIKRTESAGLIPELQRIVTEKKPEKIVLNLSEKPTKELIHFLTSLELQGIHFITFEHFMEKYLRKCFIPYDSEDLSYLDNIRPYSILGYMTKRTIDIMGAGIVLVLSLPVMLYALRRIRKESPGSILFKQKRVGLNGRLFTCYKFRSMHEDSHFDPYTRENDERIFPFGHTMRKMRIDELPQLFNVLCGDMHLIGPRAEWHILVEEYEKELPYYSERHLVRPGITGWAQVNYPYGQNIEDTRQKLMYDLYYIKYWNVWLEIKTAFKTVGVVLKKMGV